MDRAVTQLFLEGVAVELLRLEAVGGDLELLAHVHELLRQALLVELELKDLLLQHRILLLDSVNFLVDFRLDVVFKVKLQLLVEQLDFL